MSHGLRAYARLLTHESFVASAAEVRGLESGCADECETPRRCYGVRVALHTPCAMLTTAQGGAEVGGRTATTTLKCGVVAPGEAVHACRNLIADALG